MPDAEGGIDGYYLGLLALLGLVMLARYRRLVGPGAFRPRVLAWFAAARACYWLSWRRDLSFDPWSFAYVAFLPLAAGIHEAGRRPPGP